MEKSSIHIYFTVAAKAFFDHHARGNFYHMTEKTFDQYQIIPRKFRPQRFGEVVGHPQIVTTLKNAIAHDRVAQSYLFCGQRGCGKTTFARLFAKALNCPHRGDDYEPCNSCSSCKEITKSSNLDVIEIDGASNRGIEDIRQINETVGYAPQGVPYKIYIIDEVHMLTKEAFNALLKTLEEPPKHALFLFATTEPHKIPQTILSRCQRYNLGRIGEEELSKKLQLIGSKLGVKIDEEALKLIYNLSEGSLRDAESLLDQLICQGSKVIDRSTVEEMFGLLSDTHIKALDQAIQNEDLQGAATLAKELFSSGKNLNAALDGLLEYFRAQLFLPGTPHSQDQLLTILDTIMEWQQNMLKTSFKGVHLEMLFITLARSQKKVPLSSLIHRLIELEKEMRSEPPPPPNIEQQPESKAPQETAKPAAHPSKYDTLIRFASVELEGSVQQ